MTSSHRALKLLALSTWIIGGVVLFLKGYALFAEARELRPEAALTYLPFPLAGLAGSLKARYLFLPSCRNNLARIDSLPEPRIWHFFRAGFFIFLFSMILLGAWLSRMASGKYGMLLTVASVDLTISVGLVGSIKGFKE